MKLRIYWHDEFPPYYQRMGAEVGAYLNGMIHIRRGLGPLMSLLVLAHELGHYAMDVLRLKYAAHEAYDRLCFWRG